MKPKLLVVVAILVTLAVVTARSRSTPSPAPAAAPPRAAKQAVPDLKNHPALASYRVFEEPAGENTLPYRGANYKAEVGSDGLRFQAGEHTISLRARRVEQGGASIDLTAGAVTKAGWATAAVERGSGVTEEFVFENHRAEHLVRLERPVGEGALKVRVAVQTDLTGPVQQVGRYDMSWKDTVVADGGLVFTDAVGTPGLAYHGAVAIDAQGRRLEFDPRWENGEIALELPASFMKGAAYPVLIDPWLELDFSASGGGITKNGSVSETPAVNLIGAGTPDGGSSPCVAWSDNSDGDFDIYFRYWNGFRWTVLGTPNISNNNGKSTNPSIGFFTFPGKVSDGFPFIVWEDDNDGTTCIFGRFWNGSNWAELSESVTSSGISKGIGTPSRNPQAFSLLGLVDNEATGTVPDRNEFFAGVTYEREGLGIECKFFYPGDNRAIQPPPAGWYFHPAGGLVVSDPSVGRASVGVLRSTNELIIAYEGSSGAEFDIFVTRPSAIGTITVSNVTATPGPAGTWVATNACAGLPAALSIQPSVAVDPNGDVWVAWQESVGVEREIYVRRSVGGGAFASVAGSSTGAGISGTSVLGTTTTSSFPSIAVNLITSTGRPVVAWEDDFSGNTEIFVRRLNAASTAWDQVADEGSASLVAPEVTGNNGGISRTPNFSLRPKAVVAPDSTATVVWRDGATGNFDLFLRRYHDNQPTNLTQGSISGLVVSPLSVGGTSSSVNMQFSSVLVAESASLPTNLRLQLEIRPNTSPFTGQPTHESLEVAPGATAIVNFTGLPNVNYHWRARSLDAQGRGSPWVSFGVNADGEIDFRVDSNATGSGGSNNVIGTSSDHKDKCGLAGLEALALLGLAALARRRRKA
ncbi:MAG TPA: MYXO-CTERM sorting domain-containing protein [Planctomycetota bacterium]